MANHQSDDVTLTGWLVKVTPLKGGDEGCSFVAAFATDREAELEMRDHPEGRGKRVRVERQLSVQEMMQLRLRPGEIRPHA
jgi:hypothetical protein